MNSIARDSGRGTAEVSMARDRGRYIHIDILSIVDKHKSVNFEECEGYEIRVRVEGYDESVCIGVDVKG